MKKSVVLLFILVMAMCFMGCGKVYEGTKSGYVTIKDIPGITFDIYANSAKSATAVSQINKDSDMSDGNSYLYKNGSTDYIIYNNKSLTAVVQKVESIGLETVKDKESVLRDITFLGTSVLSENYEYVTSGKDDAYKLVAQVDAGVSLTLTTFGDYTGQFAYLSYQNNDYLMFVGVPKTEYKNLDKEVRDAIEHMIKSLRVNKEDFGTNKVQPTEKTDKVTETKPEDVKKEETTTQKEEVTQQPEEKEPVKQPIPSVEIEVPKEEPEEDIIITEKEVENVVNVTNQKELEGNITTIYSFGGIEDDVLSSGVDINGNFQTVLVTITAYYNEEMASDVIKSGVAKDGLYEYFDAPDGCHYEAVEYKVSGSATEDVYVNFKIVGIDGQLLKYKGVTYGSRSYDILSTSEYKKDGYTKRICYYPVPNGCKEYVLQFGETGGQLGYVKISE